MRFEEDTVIGIPPSAQEPIEVAVRLEVLGVGLTVIVPVALTDPQPPVIGML